jgi:DedD protein
MSDSVDSLKQRLVGAFVILSLAVIFLPMVFDKPHHEANSTIQMVPPKPKFETVVISKPQPIEIQPLEVDPVTGRVGEGNGSSTPNRSIVPAKEVTSISAPSKATGESNPAKDLGEEKQSAAKVPSAPEDKPPVFNNVWMVQIGTFSNKENAYTLRDKVRASGISAHTKEVDSGKAVRVFAGPFVTKKEAARIKKKVDASYKVDSLVVFFDA